MQKVEDLNDMYYFAQVVDHGGYNAASRALGVPVSSLSRRVSSLEKELGVRLLNRTTRSLSLSDPGRTFYQHSVALVAEAFAAKEAIDQTKSEPTGLIRMSCPIRLLQTDVGEVLSTFLRDNPAVRVSLDATNRTVDLVEEGFDLAMRVRVPPLADSEFAVRKLMETEMIVVGSGWLFAHHPRPQSLSEIASLPTLSMARGGDRQIWQFHSSTGEVASVSHTPRVLTDDMGTLHKLACDGIGLAYLPRSMVKADLEASRLERVLPDAALPQLVHAVFPARRGLVPAVRALLDRLAAHFETDPHGHRRP